MIPIHLLTDALRVQLKSPLGTLLKGTFDKTIKEFEKIIKKVKPTLVISVGDAVSEALLKNNIFPNVLIVDSIVMRKPIAPITAEGYETVNLKNPAGTISDDAWTVVEAAVKHHSRVKVVVEGEEDLLALVAILSAPSAPSAALIVYGQPHEGMVIVEVTPQKKDEVRSIINAMERRVLSKS